MSMQRRYEGTAAAGAKGDRAWQLVMTDPETGLPNHLVVQDRLDQALARRPRHGGEVVVCSITLDNLHLLTDEHGPAAGNQIIREVARRLTEALRTEDTVGRVGTAELVGIVTVRDKANVTTVVDRLKQALTEPVDAETASVVLEATVDVRVSDGFGSTTPARSVAPGRPLPAAHGDEDPGGAPDRDHEQVVPHRRARDAVERVHRGRDEVADGEEVGEGGQPASRA